MSKKRRKAKQQSYDLHHILFYRKSFNKGIQLKLRRAFAYEIPVEIHQHLHSTVGPVPPLTDEEARWLWTEYNRVDHEMDIFEALAWLQMHSPNAEFAVAIMAQYGFLRNRIKAV